jgi:hypothetical protein
MVDRAYGAAPAGAWTRSTWTGRTGALGRGPRWTARRSGSGRRRRRHGRPRRACSGGAAGHGQPSRGYGRARLDATNAMACIPSRVDDGEEKLVGGAASFGKNGGGAGFEARV